MMEILNAHARLVITEIPYFVSARYIQHCVLDWVYIVSLLDIANFLVITSVFLLW